MESSKEQKERIYLDRLLVICPECKRGGMWATPEGFRVAVDGRLIVTCPNGHQWQTSGAWAEEDEHGRETNNRTA